jgi:hypothetical protein
MKNVTLSQSGDILSITIDLSQDHGTSKSGKTYIIATTQGNKKINPDSNIVIGLNCYKPRG